MLLKLPIEIINIIFGYCDICSQINIISVNKYTYINYVVKYILKRNHKYLTNSILEQHKFRSLEKLKIKLYDNISQPCIDTLHLTEFYINGNHKISNINHMKNLKILSIKNNYNILDDGICNLNNLTELYIDGAAINYIGNFTNLQTLCITLFNTIRNMNSNVTYMTNLHKLNIETNLMMDISMLINLKILYADNISNINQNGIKNLDLVELHANYNEKIVDVSFMKNLRILGARGIACGITQKGIQNLNLLELYADNNTKIFDVSNMTNLQILDASYECSIGQDGIRNLNLTKLIIFNNKYIHNVAYMNNLRKLHMRYTDIEQEGINGLDLTELFIKDNSMIHDISFMHNLKKISIGSGISQMGINGLHPEKLIMTNNKHINNISFMTSLKILIIDPNCKIDQKGILGLDLINLNVANNSRIFDVSFMKRLRILNVEGSCGIDQKGICGLNLVKLFAKNNSRIYDVSFMSRLKMLDASDNCGIDKYGISGLNLHVLITYYNSKL